VNVTLIDAVIAVVAVAIVFSIFGLVLTRFKVEWPTVMTVVAGIFGIGLLVAFLGFMLVWTVALPLIIICVVVVALLIYDWINTVRFGETR
jgi:hypothetical protein